MNPPPLPPRATYRLQLHHRFTLHHANALAPYLADLGVSHLYASPLFLARPHSTHGYDLCDYNRINPELGGHSAFLRFSRTLKQLNLRLLLDIVPNHMGIGHTLNQGWTDLLRHGHLSRFASTFDVDWNSHRPGLHQKILLPVLGDHYGRTLERGELRLVHEQNQFWIAYFKQRFPVHPKSLSTIVRSKHLTSPASLCRQLNGQPGNPASFTTLDDLLNQQRYRLAFWRSGLQQLNYRRFFDITDLAGVRMEDPTVFKSAHRLIAQLLARRHVHGLRVDHPDGLRDPATYFTRLHSLFPSPPKRQRHNTSTAWILVEKILSHSEQLPNDWPVAGTTGYDFLNLLNGLFIDSRNEHAFDRIHRAFTRHHSRLDAEIFHNKLLVLDRSFAPELDALTHQLHSLAARHRHGRDYTLSQLRLALASIIAALPVYRTYLAPSRPSLPLAEQRYLVVALESARLANPDLPDALFDFIGSLLTFLDPFATQPPLRQLTIDWIARFQQLSGPAMAKGLEDTTFYSWTRFISLNEVGGHPDFFGTHLDDFHRANQDRLNHWPDSLLATATHDTKRGEDTRARLNVLSEIPAAWSNTVQRWHHLNRHALTTVLNQPAPDPSLEYLLYQTIVGSWPLPTTAKPQPDYVERLQTCLLKSAREAKTHTSWTDPNPQFEHALHSFIQTILNPRRSARFLTDLRRFVHPISLHGACNSLSQTLLKLTVPGVPDLYQGTDLWDFSLVDPDNRRPVDFAHRRTTLRSIQRACRRSATHPIPFCRDLLRSFHDGRAKMFIIWFTLQLRLRLPDLFARGEYLPIHATGPRARHVCAFRRSWSDSHLIVVVPRFTFNLSQPGSFPLGPRAWNRTFISLPDSPSPSPLRNLLTGEIIQPAFTKPSSVPRLLMADILRVFPVALLEPLNPPANRS